MSDYEFQFVDSPPPRERGRNTLYRAFADALRERPGEWAIWPRQLKDPRSAHSTAANVKRGNSGNWPAGQFDARASGQVVYVCYIGAPS